MRDLTALVVELDAALTGKQRQETERTARHQARMLADPVEFAVGGEYHLSDGGYSRVVFSEIEGRLFLTSNSREAVKARWRSADARRAAEAVEALLRQAIGLDDEASSPR